MKKLIQVLLVLGLGILHAQAQSQQGKIKGQLTDQTTKEAMPSATIVLLNAKDSTVALTTLTDTKGNFELTSVPFGAYRLYISFLGFKPVNKPLQVDADHKEIALGNLAMESKGVTLNTVEILEEKPPVVIKKDTVEFNADAFKTRENAVVEDLLKKLPGVTVDRDGAITAHGETVTKVLVDGKPFFGGDAKLATKNLPANIIDKVQVIDRKSDQAQFTGIDDGQTEKTINITIKKNKKRGIFGRASAGYGTDDRFATNLSFNVFHDTKQISLLAGGNNVNNLGYSMQDQVSFASAGGGGGMRGARGMMSNLGGGGGGGGITRNWNTGVNFSDELGKKATFTGSYFFNDTKTSTLSNSRKQTFVGDSFIVNNNNGGSISDNANNRFQGRIEYNIDSMHSLIFEPNVSITNANSYSNTTNVSYNNLGDTLNKGTTINNGSGKSVNYGGNLLLRKRFKKQGRSMSLSLNFNSSENDQENINRSSYTFYKPDSVSIFNQRNTTSSNNNSLRANFTYTEPLWRDNYLEINYGITRNENKSNKYTYDFNDSKGDYDTFNDSLSNIFSNTTFNHRGGVNIRTVKLKYDYSFGLNLVYNNLDNVNYSYLKKKDTTITQHTLNFAPQANFNYAFSRNRRLSINYNGNTTQPTVQQLAPVPDNSNPLYIQLGNPDLKPSYDNRIGLHYHVVNPDNYRSIMTQVSGSFGTNKIVNSITLDPKSGRQTVKPINVNGYYSVDARVSNSWPLSKTPGQNLNTMSYVSYNRDVNVNSGKINYNNRLTVTQSANLSYFYKELFDAGVGGSVNYTRSNNTISTGSLGLTNYFDYNINADVNFNLPLNFMIGSDITCTMNRGRTTGYNLTSTMWNANISKYITKKKDAMVKVQAFDILRQYISVSRSVADNYIIDTQNNVLQQYFMVSFTYFLNKFAAPTPRGGREGRMNFGPGGGGGRGGGGGMRRF